MPPFKLTRDPAVELTPAQTEEVVTLLTAAYRAHLTARLDTWTANEPETCGWAAAHAELTKLIRWAELPPAEARRLLAAFVLATETPTSGR